MDVNSGHKASGQEGCRRPSSAASVEIVNFLLHAGLDRLLKGRRPGGIYANCCEMSGGHNDARVAKGALKARRAVTDAHSLTNGLRNRLSQEPASCRLVGDRLAALWLRIVFTFSTEAH